MSTQIPERKPGNPARTPVSAKPAQATPNVAPTPPTGGRKRGRPVSDKEAPHGYGDDGKPLAPHGYLPSGKPRVYPARDGVKSLDLAQLESPDEVSEELAIAARPARVRSPQQIAIDGAVRKMYDKWVEAGKPSDWKDVPKGQYKVSPNEVSELKAMLTKAALMHKVRVKFGKELKTQAGAVIVVWGALDRIERKAS